MRIQSLGRADPLEEGWQLTSVLLPGESHGRRSLVGYSPPGCKESDMTERLHFTYFSLRVVVHIKCNKVYWTV